MSWQFETICPKCLKLNPRYCIPVTWTAGHPDIPICLGVTCECGNEYIAVADQVKCLACKECTWKIRGYEIMVINQYVVVKISGKV